MFLLSSHISQGQAAHQIFEHLTTDQGLSSNKAEAVLQDQEGFYWIATQNGLNRFDGTTFKIYRHDENDSTSLTDNYCTALVEGQNGDIWVATYKGLSHFIKAKGYFQQIYLNHPSCNFELRNRIYNLAIDNSGNIWMAGYGLWRYNINDNTITLFQHSDADLTAIPSYSLITQMTYDKLNDGLWISAADQLAFYCTRIRQFYNKKNNPPGWKVFDVADNAELTIDSKNRLWFRDQLTQSLSYFDFEKNQITITDKIVKNGIKRLCPDEQGRIWIFYYLAGSEIYDPETLTTNNEFFIHHHRLSILSERGCNLYIDRQKNNWIVSYSGISIYNESNQFYSMHQLEIRERGKEDAPFKILAVAQTEPGSIWILSNLGLYKYNLNSGAYERIETLRDDHNIHAFCADGNQLWIGYHDTLVRLDTKSGKESQNFRLKEGMYFVRKGTQDDLWVGLWSGGLYHVDLTTREIKYFTKSDSNSSSIKSNELITGFNDGENFWIGYNGGNGFSKYSAAAKSFIHYLPQVNEASISRAGTVTSITADHSGHLWLGTHGSGIFRFDSLTNTFDNYQQQLGLNSNYINSILTDEQGNLWISTADGMNYFNPEDSTIHQLGIDLVFPENDFQANGIRGVNGKLYFFCKNEFVEIDPIAYHPKSDFPSIVLSSFKIFDKEIPVNAQQQELNLGFRENFFTIAYSAIKTNPNKDVKYAYQLDGFDKNWIMAGHQIMASYTNVPEGTYRFNVKATNEKGEWSNVLLALSIHIKPPFWHTWWFITLCAITVISIIYVLYKFRMNQLNKLALLRAKISQDLHDELGSSLSSIHVYSSVATKALDKDLGITKKALNHIYQNSRQVMNDMSDIVWAINQGKHGESTLENKLKNYGYELLTPLNIKVTYDIEKEIDHRLNHIEARKNILLIAKEAMNNIARYSQATEATVYAEINNKHLLLKISDNGKGFSVGDKRTGNGLRNMRHRTEAMGGQFTLKSEENNGTSLTCSIPVTNISNT